MGFVTGLKQFPFGKVGLLVISLGSLERFVFGICSVSTQKVRIVVGISSDLILRNVVKVFAVVILVGGRFGEIGVEWRCVLFIGGLLVAI